MSKIVLLVTGGSGLVGHALQKIHPDAVFISSNDFDLTKESDVISMYEQHNPTQIIHLAAKVGGIFKNMNQPAELLYQNLLMNTHVVHNAYKYKVKKFIGVLSNCSYPDVAKSYPAKEEYFYDGPPQKTNFAYAYSKRALGVQIESYKKQYGCKFVSVIPCNLYGPNDNFDKKDSHFVAALIRKIHEAKQANKKELELFGTGKPLRQYMYSEDLANILLILLNKYNDKGPINIAPKDQNYSIATIAQIALKAMDAEGIKPVFDKNSPDGQYRKDISIDKLEKIIGKYNFTDLEEGIKKTYEWYLKSMKTYQKGE